MKEIQLNKWYDELIWCPSQCYYYFMHNGDMYCIYLRWRHQDPWTADIIKCAEGDFYINNQAATWKSIRIPYFKDSELDELKEFIMSHLESILKKRIDLDCDYAFLIALEKKKLQRMHDYFKRESILERKDIVVRDIAICIRLIDIFMEDDAVHNTWLHQSYSGKMRFRKLEKDIYELDASDRKPIADYPVYVNVKNERRFFRRTPIKDAQLESNRTAAILSITLLRQAKALHLYHLIREYKLFEWWC